MVVNGELEFNDDRTDEILNPLLVVEVFSPSMEAYDRGEKFRKYRSLASFCEYLRVSQAEPYIEQYYKGDRPSSERWQWQVCDRLDRAIVYEIVNGELIDVGNRSVKHGYTGIILSAALFNCVSMRKLGGMFDSSTAFKMKLGNKRSPDVSFMAKERLQGLDDLPDGFLEGAPDLAVEILCPGNTVAEIHDKLVEYFENGARLVWVIHPKEGYVLVYRSSQEPGSPPQVYSIPRWRRNRPRFYSPDCGVISETGFLMKVRSKEQHFLLV